MLRICFATLAGIGGVELTVKLHPRSPDDPVVRALLSEHPSLKAAVVCRGRLEDWFAGIDCALSCGSSAGVEATLAGVPVIQLAPPGAAWTLPHNEWGLAGTATDPTQLQELLARVLVEGWRPPSNHRNVFHCVGDSAAGRVAEEVLAHFGTVDAPMEVRRPEVTPAAA